jgi:hypothetical protein
MLSLSIAFLASTNIIFAQDTTWTQVLPAWVDDVYYPTFFLGGNYYTRISLADIDGDGDLDMFYGGGGSGSLVYFENVGTPQEPRFELGMEQYPGLSLYFSTSGCADADFGDLDGDGDLDAAFAVDRNDGGFIVWNDGNSQQANFIYRPPYGQGGQGNVTLVDIDADGDLDLFSGAGYFDYQLIFIENIGTDTLPNFIRRSFNYQDLNFGIPFNFDMGDIDGDGDYDIIVCKRGGPVALYTNIGTPQSPGFALADSDYFSFRDTTDYMEVPELADIDADGDLDLFLAGAYAHLYFFENTGTPTQPLFVQRYDTSYFYNFRGVIGSRLCGSADLDNDGDQDINVGGTVLINESLDGEFRFRRYDHIIPYYIGQLCDLDSDGDFDLVCVGPPNTPGYFENIGGPSWPQYEENGRDLFPEDGHLTNPFDVALADLDADGDLDLYVTHAAGNNLVYYRNDGTPQAYDFTYQGDIILPEMTYQTYTGIYFADMDLDGDYDLFLSDMSGNPSYPLEVRFFYYRNDGTPQAPSWTYVTNDFQNIVRDHRPGGLTICPTDIDGDGDKDLMLSVGLGLQLYLNPLDPDAIEEDIPTPIAGDLSLSCYPNPFNSNTIITINNSDNINISIFDITGRLVATLKAEKGRAIWDAAGFTSGIYFARVKDGDKGQSIKLILLK